jgi:hypothetical protein
LRRRTASLLRREGSVNNGPRYSAIPVFYLLKIFFPST